MLSALTARRPGSRNLGRFASSPPWLEVERFFPRISLMPSPSAARLALRSAAPVRLGSLVENILRHPGRGPQALHPTRAVDPAGWPPPRSSAALSPPRLPPPGRKRLAQDRPSDHGSSLTSPPGLWPAHTPGWYWPTPGEQTAPPVAPPCPGR